MPAYDVWVRQLFQQVTTCRYHSVPKVLSISISFCLFISIWSLMFPKSWNTALPRCCIPAFCLLFLVGTAPPAPSGDPSLSFGACRVLWQVQGTAKVFHSFRSRFFHPLSVPQQKGLNGQPVKTPCEAAKAGTKTLGDEWNEMNNFPLDLVINLKCKWSTCSLI